MNNYLSPETLANYSAAQLEELRAICNDALRVNREKVLVAYTGYIAAHETLLHIDAILAAKQQPEPDGVS